jgi:nicotinamidase-related amidase
MKTLILIDFQTHYCSQMGDEKRKELIENVTRISKVFMVNNWPIIVVYFDSSYNDNYIIQEMEDILKYENSIFVTKTRCDGSEQILDQIDLHRWPLNVIVCGVYGNECVQETVNGLAERDKDISITILKDCIWPDCVAIDPDNEDKIEIHHQSELVIV